MIVGTYLRVMAFCCCCCFSVLLSLELIMYGIQVALQLFRWFVCVKFVVEQTERLECNLILMIT